MIPTPELVDHDEVEDRLRPLMILVFSLKTAAAALLLANFVVHDTPQNEYQAIASLGSQPVQ